MAIWYLYTNIWKPVGRLRVSPSLSSSLGTRCLYFTRPGEVDWIRYAEFVGSSDKKWNKLFPPNRKYDLSLKQCRTKWGNGCFVRAWLQSNTWHLIRSPSRKRFWYIETVAAFSCTFKVDRVFIRAVNQRQQPGWLTRNIVRASRSQ